MQFQDYTVYQSYGWGEHKRRFGWRPLRLVATRDAQMVSMAQVLVKRYPLRMGLAWVPGGPVGEPGLWNDEFRSAIRKVAGARHLYCRISSMREYTDEEASTLSTGGWTRCSAPLLSGMSLAYSPDTSESVRLGQCSGNWHRNLRRSARHGLAVRGWPAPEPDEMLEAYASMQAHKQLKEQISRAEISSLLDSFPGRYIMVRCDDSDGRLLALRGALVLGGKAWDTFAVATVAGRKVYASHAAFWELMKQCAERGVRWYDMGGVDPVNNRGVYDFKKGTGARALEYLGEWEWSTSKALGWGVSRLIALQENGG